MTTVDTLVVPDPGLCDLAFLGLPAGARSCRLIRSWAGRSTQIRGTELSPLVGSTWRWIDYAMPCAVDSAGVEPVVYRLEPLDAGGVTIAAGVIEATVPPILVDHSHGWLSDPLYPGAAVPVTVLTSGEDGWESDGETLTPLAGLSVATGRTRRRRAVWRLTTVGRDTAARVQGMVERGGPLLLRADPECIDHPTGAVYADMAEVAVYARRGAHAAKRVWTLSGIECAAPLGVAVPTRTYADTQAEFGVYGATRAALPTYLDRARGQTS